MFGDPRDIPGGLVGLWQKGSNCIMGVATISDCLPFDKSTKKQTFDQHRVPEYMHLGLLIQTGGQPRRTLQNQPPTLKYIDKTSGIQKIEKFPTNLLWPTLKTAEEILLIFQISIFCIDCFFHIYIYVNFKLGNSGSSCPSWSKICTLGSWPMPSCLMSLYLFSQHVAVKGSCRSTGSFGKTSSTWHQLDPPLHHPRVILNPRLPRLQTQTAWSLQQTFPNLHRFWSSLCHQRKRNAFCQGNRNISYGPNGSRRDKSTLL